jgi:hypothetical protein
VSLVFLAHRLQLCQSSNYRPLLNVYAICSSCVWTRAPVLRADPGIRQSLRGNARISCSVSQILRRKRIIIGMELYRLASQDRRKNRASDGTLARPTSLDGRRRAPTPAQHSVRVNNYRRIFSRVSVETTDNERRSSASAAVRHSSCRPAAAAE